MTTYTLDAGRCFVRDGTPLATLSGVAKYDPCEVDKLARDIVLWANSHADLLAALRDILEDSHIDADELDLALDALSAIRFVARAAIAKAEGKS